MTIGCALTIISTAKEPLNNSARARRSICGLLRLGLGSAVSCLVRFAEGKKRLAKKRSARAVSCLVRFAEGKKRLVKKRTARVVWLFQISEPDCNDDCHNNRHSAVTR